MKRVETDHVQEWVDTIRAKSKHELLRGTDGALLEIAESLLQERTILEKIEQFVEIEIDTFVSTHPPGYPRSSGLQLAFDIQDILKGEAD